MFSWKKVLSEQLKEKIKEHLLVPYPGVKKLKETIMFSSDSDVFYFGNVRKKNIKNELTEMRKFKPDFVIDFLEGTEAISKSGEDISNEYSSIYFTVKKGEDENES